MPNLSDRADLLPPRERRRLHYVVLAVIVHVLLFVVLGLNIHWRSHTPPPAQAELWSTLPQVGSADVPTPTPTPVPPRAETPQAAPETLDQQREADIAIRRKKQQIEDAKRQAALAAAEQAREQAQQAAQARAAAERQAHLQKQAAADKAAALKQQQVAAEKAARLKAQQDAQRQAQAEQQAAAAKAAAAKAAAAKEAAAKRAAAKAAANKQAAAAADAQRQAYLKRMQGMVDSAGGGAGSAAASGGSSGATRGGGSGRGYSSGYASRVAAAVRRNLLYSGDTAGNPAAEVIVNAAMDGTILSVRLLKSSGNPAWDEATVRAIHKTGVLPRDTDGRVPSSFQFVFRPHDD